MATDRPFLVDWWAAQQEARRVYQREASALEHEQRLLSPELLGVIHNRPVSVIDLQALHDRVLSLMGVK